MEYRLSELPGGGVAATDATLREIARICQNDLRQSPAVRFQATQILGSVSGKDHVGEARALFEWVRRHVRYQKDPVGIETVQSPVVTLRLRAGDCDDHAALLASLAIAVGIPARFRVLGASADNFIHIVPELYAGGRWWWADTTERLPFGVRPRPLPVERIYNFQGEVSMLGQSETLPVTAGQFKASIRDAVWRTLQTNWQNGLINEDDVRSYLRVIDEGNFFSKKPLLVDPTRATIAEFLAWVPSHLGPSRKRGVGGLSGLDGFLSSIVKAVGSVVKGAVNLVTGGGSPTVQIQYPPAPTTATAPVAPTVPVAPPAVMSAGMPTWAWVAIAGLAAVVVLPMLIGGRPMLAGGRR
jgi:hypothetical protein